MQTAAATTPRGPLIYRAGFVLLVGLALWGGLYLDAKAQLTITDLFVAFYVASLAGLASGIWPFVFGTRKSRSQTLALMAGVIVWRIAYFPLLVLSGWVATWFDGFSYAARLPVTGIYAIFLPAVFSMHFGVAWITALVVVRRLWLPLIPGVPILALALLVSFNRPVDLTVLPDQTITRELSVATQPLPHGNVYARLLASGNYNPAQYTLLYSGLILYELIPSAPWSLTVKQVIAQGVLENPSGSTADRIYEHYAAFLLAQPCVRRGDECSAKDRI